MIGWFLVLLVGTLVVAVLPRWDYSRKWGYWPSGLLGTVLFVLLLLAMLGL